MKNIGSEVKEIEEVEEVKEVKDQQAHYLSPRRRQMCEDEPSFSFTSCTSFTSFTSLAFTGVCP